MPSGHAREERDLRSRIASVPHWYHRIELAPGLVTPGVNDSPAMLARLPLAAVAGADVAQVPLLRLYPLGSLNGDLTNCFVPNAAGLCALVEMAGFRPEGPVDVQGGRGVLAARRTADAVAEHVRARDGG